MPQPIPLSEFIRKLCEDEAIASQPPVVDPVTEGPPRSEGTKAKYNGLSAKRVEGMIAQQVADVEIKPFKVKEKGKRR